MLCVSGLQYVLVEEIGFPSPGGENSPKTFFLNKCVFRYFSINLQDIGFNFSGYGYFRLFKKNIFVDRSFLFEKMAYTTALSTIRVCP